MVKSIIFHLKGTLVYQQIVQYNKTKPLRIYRVYKGIVSNMTIKRYKIMFSNFS